MYLKLLCGKGKALFVSVLSFNIPVNIFSNVGIEPAVLAC